MSFEIELPTESILWANRYCKLTWRKYYLRSSAIFNFYESINGVSDEYDGKKLFFFPLINKIVSEYQWQIKKHPFFQKEKDRFYYLKNRKNRTVSRGKNIQKYNANQNKKKQIINYYTDGLNRCQCCGYIGIDFLTVDHKNNDGSKHRKEIGGSQNLYDWIIKNNYPNTLQILCFNCNFSKQHNNGMCSHLQKNVHA